MKGKISLSLQHLACERSTTTFWNYRNHETSLWPSISVTVQESLEQRRHPLIFGKVSCFLYWENCHIVVGIKYNTSWSCDFLVCYKMSPGQLTCFCFAQSNFPLMIFKSSWYWYLKLCWKERQLQTSEIPQEKGSLAKRRGPSRQWQSGCKLNTALL